MRQLIWFRTDLRVQDNSALAAAMQAGPAIALFIITPGQWLAHDDAASKVDFWLRNLRALQSRLAQLNVPLLIRRAENWDEVPALLAELCRAQAIECVQVNEEYGVNEARRDHEVAALLRASGVAFRHHVDQLLFPPGTILTRSGGYFQVFSQFRKVCYQRLHTALPMPVALPKPQVPMSLGGDPLPASVSGFVTPNPELQALWPDGEEAALDRLATFADARLEGYDRHRDLPACPGTSQLSPYLAAGCSPPVSVCMPRCAITRASSRPAAVVLLPGSTSCCGVNSTSTSWSAFPRFHGIKRSAGIPTPCPGGMPPMNWLPGSRAAPVSR